MQIMLLLKALGLYSSWFKVSPTCARASCSCIPKRSTDAAPGRPPFGCL